MLFFRKLILLAILGGGAGIPIAKAVGTPEEKIEMTEYESTLKRWRNILASVPGDNETEKVSLLFSRNLTTFSENTISNVVKQLLMEWIIKIWQNPEGFHPISQKLNKFFFYYHFHYWKTKNDLDDFSWNLVKNFFTDFFFGEKGWFLLSQFGDFREFVFQEWLKKEKPFSVYEWNIKYSSDGQGEKTFSSENYRSISKSTNKDYLWPKFGENSKYREFMTNLKNSKPMEFNKQFRKKLLTISELQKISDGRKLATYLHLLNLSSNGFSKDIIDEFDLTKSNSQDVLQNPLLLFLEKLPKNNQSSQTQEQNKHCLLVEKSVFDDNFWKKIPVKNGGSNGADQACLYGIREIKTGFISGVNKIFASREADGINFYYIPRNNKLNSQYLSIDSMDKEIKDQVIDFLSNNFEKTFFKYLLSKSSSNSSFSFKLTLNNGTKTEEWSFKEYFEKHKEIFKLINEYLDQLYWVGNIKKFSTNLSSIYKEVPTSFKVHSPQTDSDSSDSSDSSQENEKMILLKPTDGLFSPHPFKRKIDTSEESSEEEIKFESLRRKRRSSESQKENNGSSERKNDGFYVNLFSPFMKETDIYSLEEKANDLKEKLKGESKSELLKISSLEETFKNEPLQRAQLEKLSENKSLIMNTLFLEKIRELFSKQNNENPEESSISELISSFSKFLEENLKNNEESEESEESDQDNNGDKWSKIINHTFFLNSWLNLPTEERSIFGSYKKSNEDSEEEGQEEGSENEKNLNPLITKSKNSWVLRNYYLSDGAYESNSKSNQELLSYLYSIYWLTKDKNKNLSKLINHIFSQSSNKNAYLVWLKEIDQKKIEELTKEEEGDYSQKIKILPSSFVSELPTDLQNPLLLGEMQLSKDKEEKNQEKSFHSNKTIFTAKAAKKNVSEEKEREGDMKLSGFLGLIGPKFSTREIPEELRQAIFDKFWNSNSYKNTNFSSEKSDEEGESSQQNSQILEGLFFEDNWKTKLENNSDLKELLGALHLKRKLKKYLNIEDPIRPTSTLLQALHSYHEQHKSNEEFDVDYWTIEELKKKISEVLEQDNNQQVQVAEGQRQEGQQSPLDTKNLYRMWNRFSGFLQTGVQNKSPYIFTIDKGGQKKNYLTFLYQVNQFDFEEENIGKLKENLSEETVDLLISLLASSKEAREWIYNNELVRQLNT
ncbi:DUF3713 domain-containing protein [Mycoplasma suis]|uniref:Uncharacterized protein n=1 Tax=Mycoplasma suis (strain Illinois) TaxID=768700 RepID=F0QQW7_MYCSL|nr:DUF3713 domain-containing protein [Mycoplasma suis]ADX97887.1 hypothetical protein MSU_0345 [Mycoplasma suis str. Illinois]